VSVILTILRPRRSRARVSRDRRDAFIKRRKRLRILRKRGTSLASK